MFSQDLYETSSDQNVPSSQMTEADHKFIAKSMTLQEFKAGDNVLSYGELGEEFFIVLKGKSFRYEPKRKMKDWRNF